MTQKSNTPLTVAQAAKKIKAVCMEDPLGEFIWQHLEPCIDKLNDENLSLKQQWELIYSAYECLDNSLCRVLDVFQKIKSSHIRAENENVKITIA